MIVHVDQFSCSRVSCLASAASFVLGVADILRHHMFGRWLTGDIQLCSNTCSCIAAFLNCRFWLLPCWFLLPTPSTPSWYDSVFGIVFRSSNVPVCLHLIFDCLQLCSSTCRAPLKSRPNCVNIYFEWFGAWQVSLIWTTHVILFILQCSLYTYNNTVIRQDCK